MFMTRLTDNETFVLPATVAQQAFVQFDQLEPGNPAFNIAIRFRLTGTLDIGLLEQSVNEIVRRHESLRTVARLEDGIAKQFICGMSTLSVQVDDLRDTDEFSLESRGEQLAHEEASRSFDLAIGPLVRVRVVHLSDQDHLLLVTFHHVIADGWSTGVFMRELATLYGAHQKGESPRLPELSLQFGDFAVWQSNYLECEDYSAKLSYWREHLSAAPTIDLPTDRRRPDHPVVDGDMVSTLLPIALTESLKRLSKRESVTLFMVTLAALKALICRLSGGSDIVVGSMVSGRSAYRIGAADWIVRQSVALAYGHVRRSAVRGTPRPGSRNCARWVRASRGTVR